MKALRSSRRPVLRSREQRGSALTEFALVVPALVTILMFSMFFTELIRMKLKMQEASRYVAWEMTSYMLSDYAANNHDGAFQSAMDRAVAEANDRYKDLDSIENDGAINLVASMGPLTITIDNVDAPMIDPKAAGNVPVVGTVAGIMNTGMGLIFSAWGYNRKGKVRVTITSTFQNNLLRKNFMDGPGGMFRVDQHGGQSLDNFELRSQFTMVANGWSLPDGADVVTAQSGQAKRAGNHRAGAKPAGMYLQTQRVAHLGINQLLGKLGPLKTLSSGLKFLPLPTLISSPMPTYVVSHNYEEEAKDQGCDNGNLNYTGIANLARKGDDKGPGLDEEDKLRCFDTAPFRDTHEWDQSMYREMFKARGDNFMGCKQEQADDPTVRIKDLSKSSKGDKNKSKVACAP